MLSNCISDAIKTCNNGGLIMVLDCNQFTCIYIVFHDLPLFLRFSLIFMNMQIRSFASLAMG